MRKYISYLKYVMRHKWFVLLACWEKGIRWRGITHDLSKFLPSEFIPYARHFYGPDSHHKDGSHAPVGDTEDTDFYFAWLLHQKRNKHHWQWWILPLDDGGNKIMMMKRKYIEEMMCDWQGASMAQGHGKNTKEWYFKNKNKMILSKITRVRIELIYKLFDN